MILIEVIYYISRLNVRCVNNNLSRISHLSNIIFLRRNLNMSKKNKNKKSEVKSEIRIPEDVRKFSSMTLKKFKKKNGDLYDGKKELRKGFYQELTDYMGGTIEFLVKFGYIRKPEVIETKNGCLEKFYDEDFVKYLIKEIKKNDDSVIENIKLLPIVLKDVLAEILSVNTKRLAEDPNAAQMSTAELCDLIKVITKSKFKTLTKAGIDEGLAFDIVMIVPCNKAWKYSRTFRIKSLVNVLYEHAKTKKIAFADIIQHTLKEEDIPYVITYCLSEKKERFGNLSDSQKEFYMSITTWCFDTMEKMNKNDIETIIDGFIKIRRNDDSRGLDGNRRYALSGLSEIDYPKISKVIGSMLSDNESIRKYLN